MKILIIEGDEDLRWVASLSLRLIGGLQVLEAEKASHAVKLAEDERPDAILLDLAMSESDLQTINSLKTNPDTALIPLVFLTTRTMSADLDRMDALGAKGVLFKPFDPMTLAIQIREIVNR